MIQPRLGFYVMEIASRLMLAVLAFLLPVNLLTNDVRIYWERARDLSPHHLPYSDFLWEYPPLTILPLLYLPLTGRTSPGFHFLFVPTMIAFEYGSLCLIRRARNENFREITMYWSAVIVPISMLVWFRFDYMSIFFATIVMLGIEKKKPIVLPILLGFLAKLWPIFFVGVLFARREFRKVILVLVTCTAATVAWWIITPEGFHTFLEFRRGEGFQIESIPGSLLLLLTHRQVVYTYGALNLSDSGFGWLQVIMNLVSVVGPVVITLMALRVKRRNDVALTAGIIAFVLCFDRLISVQFLVWLAPFIAYLWPQYKRLGLSYAGMLALTDVLVLAYRPMWRGNYILDMFLVVRDLWLVWITVLLLQAAFRPLPDETDPALSSEPTAAKS